MLEKIIKTAEFLASKGIKDPDAGIVLGTGLGGLTAEIDIRLKSPTRIFPIFPFQRFRAMPASSSMAISVARRWLP